MDNFTDLEQVKAFYPFFSTAILHGFKPISRGEAALLSIGQKQSTGAFMLNQEPPKNSGAIDLFEVRGSTLYKNGVPSVGQDTGAIYINHYYDSDFENLQDFSEGDLITILYSTGKIKKFKNRPHPEYIYNHETTMLVRCCADFSTFNSSTIQTHGVRVRLEGQEQTARAAAAIIFLHGAGLIPLEGNQPRPINDQLINYR